MKNGDHCTLWLKWGLITVGVLLVAGGICWAFGHWLKNDAGDDARESERLEYAMTIPAIELPEASVSQITDMIGLVVYQGNVYTQAGSYAGIDADRIEHLVGDYLGSATGRIDEWSSQDEYATKFASTTVGEVHTVEGYSSEFRICILSSFQENGASEMWIQFFERLNGIGITTGEDLFGDRLHLRDRVTSLKSQRHDDWNEARHIYHELSDISRAQTGAFLDDLYAGSFVNLRETEEVPRTNDPADLAHLYLVLDDATVAELILIKGGYVGYRHLRDYFVRMPGEAFDVLFDACSR